MKQVKTKVAEIWAIGGGKGGTGKTFLFSQLATYLALKKKQVILIDSDFGGANLRYFFNIKKSEKSIKNFFVNKEPLENLLSHTNIKNLKIITGDRNSISINTIKYSQKMKFLKHIKMLNADYILIDLGGGLNFNTIDIFLLADKMIVITVPEITAIDNLFQFVKNAYFRNLNFLLKKNKLKDAAKNIWKDRKIYGIKDIVDLTDYIKGNLDFDGSISKKISEFSIFIVLNKLRNPNEINQGFSIKSLCIKYLGIPSIYAGYIAFDDNFRKNLSISDYLPKFKISTRIQKEITEIAENIINKEQIKISNIKNA